jgi:hypothetical protein
MLDGVFHLADIARPVVGHEQGREASAVIPVTFAVFLNRFVKRVMKLVPRSRVKYTSFRSLRRSCGSSIAHHVQTIVEVTS